MRHITTLFDLSIAEIQQILKLSAELKERIGKGDRPDLFKNRVLAMLFEKPSLRTRNSFEAAAIQLGGGSIFLSCADAGLNGRESLPDVSRVLSSYSDIIVMRTFEQSLIDNFSLYSSCPVINGLSDDRHPCQALTDIFTMQEEFGDLQGRKLVFVGDGNNVATSLAILCAMMKINFVLSSPEGYELPETFLTELKQRLPDSNTKLIRNPEAAVQDADIIYTDVWASMGQETEADKRKQAFKAYQVNSNLLAAAPKHCRFMHDLPAKRGLEVTDEVMDGPQSIVFEQAENRMHIARGLIAWLTEHGM